MSLSASKPSAPRAGSISSLVRWHLARGSSVTEVKAAVRARLPNARNDYLNRSITYWQNARKQANAIMKGAGNKAITADGIAASTKNPTMIRVTVKGRLNLPNAKGGAKEGGFTYDVPTGLTRNQLIAYVRTQILNDLWDIYQDRGGNKGAFSRRLGTLRITE